MNSFNSFIKYNKILNKNNFIKGISVLNDDYSKIQKTISYINLIVENLNKSFLKNNNEKNKKISNKLRLIKFKLLLLSDISKQMNIKIQLDYFYKLIDSVFIILFQYIDLYNINNTHLIQSISNNNNGGDNNNNNNNNLLSVNLNNTYDENQSNYLIEENKTYKRISPTQYKLQKGGIIYNNNLKIDENTLFDMLYLQLDSLNEQLKLFQKNCEKILKNKNNK